MKFCWFAATAAILIFTISLAHAQNATRGCAAQHYKVIALPFHPSRINNYGVIAGNTEDHQPATWSQKDGLRQIELPSGFASAEATGINGAGDVVGFATRAGSNRTSSNQTSSTQASSNHTVAFRYSGGQFLILSEERSKAAAINDSDLTVGTNGDRLVWWLQRKMLPLGGCCGGSAHAVNNRGQAVGEANDKDGHYNAFLWDSTKGLRSIAPAHTVMSTALAVNESGSVLIQTFGPNAVYLREKIAFIPVHLAPEGASQPLALSSCDVIVGEFGAASDFYHAFLWDRPHGFRDLNKLIDGAEGWNLESAVDINDRGEIVGVGDRGSQQDLGFLLVPDKNLDHREHRGTQR
jgi:probable HAF family extracellular repeat protein